MSKLMKRRSLLQFFGVAAGTAIVGSLLPGRASASTPIGPSFLNGSVTPLRLPHNLPIYEIQNSYLPSGDLTTSFLSTGGAIGNNAGNLTQYTLFDDIVVAPEFEYYSIIAWGDKVFPNSEEYFGYNCDYTAFTPLSADLSDGLLWVNHEYVSHPISAVAPGLDAAASLLSQQATFQNVIGFSVDVNNQQLRYGEFQYNTGGSVVRITKDGSGKYVPNANKSANRRYHGQSGLKLNQFRTDSRVVGSLPPVAYNTITSWGALSYQQGDFNFLIGTGPVARDVFPTSTDGLGNKIIGTSFNCSGGYTPWGTVLSAEENFQGSAPSTTATPSGLSFFAGTQESVLPDGRQAGYVIGTPSTYTDPISGGSFLNITTGTFVGQVGEKYGYMVEIDMTRPSPTVLDTATLAEINAIPNESETTFRARKHTALGRFRHENVAFFSEVGKPVVLYMGDDRRGGHTWRYVSKGRFPARTEFLSDAAYKNACSKLLEDGTLFVAQFNPNGTGRWIPLTLSAQVNPSLPSVLGSTQATAQGQAVTAISAIILRLPRRNGVAGQTVDGGAFNATPSNEATVISSYRTKGGTISGRVAQLRDYYTTQGAILSDCYLAANLAGGTPTARPEDIEVNPNNPREIFIAYTDGGPSGDGYPDSRIFVVNKYSAVTNDTQPFGGLYKIIENSTSNSGATFTWERFLQGGEVNSAAGEDGDGFAAVDNLSFDQDGNIWGVTDMSTGFHNGFSTSSYSTVNGKPLQPAQVPGNHTATGRAEVLLSTFGNNWLFYVPVSGPNVGQIVPFAYGPTRCEMTGPTFVGNTLIMAVQHPSEEAPINEAFTPVLPQTAADNPAILSRPVEMLGAGGVLYNQTRTLPRGSNWPSNINGTPFGSPKPTVIGFRRKPAAS
jgi:uncharacterized protein